MKKILSYTTVFVVGFIACALALKTLGDPNLSLLPASERASKRAVLTALDTTPHPAAHFAGDSVIADAAAKLEPSIVTIHTKGHPVQASLGPYRNDPLFRQFFGNQPPQTPEGAGSGVIISADGYIMTNYHVVANAETVKVNVSVGENTKEYTARVVGTDPFTDIAVLKIDPVSPLRPAVLGDSNSVRVGDWAIAVGNPLDIGETVTLGIISAKDRKDLSAEGHSLAGTRLQTDAAINPGNSGGALADINGRVIGINEAILSPTGSFIGIGLAIPIDDAKKIAAELIKDGKVVHPYLGVSYEPLKDIDDLSVRRQYGLPLDNDNGVIVSNVYPKSPAAVAGLQQGDLIVSVDGKTIGSDISQLQDEINTKGVGDKLTLDITRKGHPMTLTVTLKQRPAAFGMTTPQDQQPQPQQNPQGDQGANPFFP